MTDLVVVRIVYFLFVSLKRENLDYARAGAHGEHALISINCQVRGHFPTVLLCTPLALRFDLRPWCLITSVFGGHSSLTVAWSQLCTFVRSFGATD